MATFSYEELEYRYNPYTKQMEQIDITPEEIDGITTAIEVNAADISLKVSSDEILSEINLSTEGVYITGDRIQLSGDVSVLGTFTMDQINDGTIYGKILNTSISAGQIILSETSGDLDDILDGTTYNKTTVNEVTGAGRGYNALSSSNRYQTWLDASELASATLPDDGLVLGSQGIIGRKTILGVPTTTFSIDTNGDAFFAGELGATNILSTGSIFTSAVFGSSTQDVTMSGGKIEYNDNLNGRLTTIYGQGIIMESGGNETLQINQTSSGTRTASIEFNSGGNLSGVVSGFSTGLIIGATGKTVGIRGKLKIPVGTNLY